MRKERTRYLLEQYYNETLSRHETAELAQIIDQTDQEEMIDILTETLNSSTAEENIPIDESEIKTKVNEILAIDKGFQIKANHRTISSKLFKYSISTAAAVIVLFGLYWAFQQNFSANVNQKNLVKTIEKDVQPGQDGAVLVLSDGTEVLLDSSGSSKVVVDRDGSKIRINNGQVVYLDNKAITQNNFNSIRTPAGRKYNLTLSDGTKVWLNAASSIEYPIVFSKKTREVTISGEAYFEVAKDAQKPFIVNIQNSKTNIAVLGTHFNVNTYADNGNYKTTLLEGSILLNTGKRQFLLKPNQQAVSQPLADQIQLFNNIDPASILAWKNDLFYFEKASIDEVMRDLARWYDIEVSYEGDKPSGTFTGKIGKDLTLRQTLKILGATRVKYELTEDNKLIIQ